MIVDNLKSCYRTTMRIREDPPLVVPVRWYWAPPGALPLPCTTAFQSMVWENTDHDFPAVGLGEVTLNRKWDKGVAPPGVTGRSTSTPLAWFQDGLPADYPYPPPFPGTPAVVEIRQEVGCVADTDATLTDEGALAALADQMPTIRRWSFLLFVWPPDVDDSTQFSDLQEASYPGYARITPAWTDPAITAPSQAGTQAGTVHFVRAAGDGPPQTIFGWALMGPDLPARLRGVQALPTPRTLAAPGDNVTLCPVQLLLGECPEPPPMSIAIGDQVLLSTANGVLFIGAALDLQQSPYLTFTPTGGLVVQGPISAPTTPIQQWLNSAGAVTVLVTQDGALTVWQPDHTNRFTFTGNMMQLVGVGPHYIYDLSFGSVITFVQNGAIDVNSKGLTVTDADPARVALTVTGAASQTADLQRWASSGGTVLASVSGIGAVTVSPGDLGGGGAGTAVFTVHAGTGSGAVDLLALRADGTLYVRSSFNVVVFAVRPADGFVQIGTGFFLISEDIRSSNYVRAEQFVGYTVSTRVMQTNLSGVGFRFVAGSSTDVVTAIQATTGQSANLEEWRKDDGTVFSAVTAKGAYQPAHQSDTSAVDDSIYYSTDTSTLCYKDPAGVVHKLY